MLYDGGHALGLCPPYNYFVTKFVIDLRNIYKNDAKSFLSGGRGKQSYERKRITDAGEGRQYTLPF